MPSSQSMIQIVSQRAHKRHTYVHPTTLTSLADALHAGYDVIASKPQSGYSFDSLRRDGAKSHALRYARGEP